jgi:hypothetical protein
MQTTESTDPSGYPVMVYDINGDPLSVAYGKEEYISIWNVAPANIASGQLYGSNGAFTFLFVRSTGSIPEVVLGNPLGEITGGDHREIITDSGETLLADDGQAIITE